jgi:hypothetical protein
MVELLGPVAVFAVLATDRKLTGVAEVPAVEKGCFEIVAVFVLEQDFGIVVVADIRVE